MWGDDNFNLGRRPALDGIRGLAVLAVVASHSLVPGAGNAGTTGVTVFFTLSGFLITRLLLEEHRETGRIHVLRFYVRRGRRLLPALAVFLLFAWIALARAGSPVTPVVVSALQVANIANVIGTPMNGLSHMWSLSMEEQFYALWPLALTVALAPRRRPLLVPALIVCTVASSVARTWLELGDAPDTRFMFGPDARADALLLGCLVAVCLPRLRTLLTGRLALGGFVVLAACVPLGGTGAWTLLPCTLASAAVVLWAVTTNSKAWPSRALGSRPLVLLGRVSYGVYLWHLPFALLYATRFPWWLAGPLTLVTSVAIGAVSWLLVERPIRADSRPPSTPRAAVEAGAPQSGMPPARVSGRHT